MKQALVKYVPILLSLCFAVVMVLFWVFPHISLLLYQEQYQLFLFDSGYFVERMSVPGGFTDYIAEFCTQFNYMYVVGAILLSAWFLLSQVLMWQLCRRHQAAACWYPLSFLPALLVWWYMSDENVMLSFLVSMDAALALMWLSELLGECLSLIRRGLCWLVLLPVSYWLFGPVVLMVSLYAAIIEVTRHRSLLSIGMAAVMILIPVIAILVSYQFLQYPLARLFKGLGYYRYPVYDPAFQYGLMVTAVLLPFAIGHLPQAGRRLVAPLLTLVIAVGGYCLLSKAYRGVRFDLIEYDYLVRTRQWDAIIKKAETQEQPTPMTVSCANYALSQKGQLCDRLFEFYQNGSEGLFPSFTRNMTSPVSTAEIFYSLGMVNDARRYMYEAQEAIPNFRQSGRLTMRIAQCDIINGQYAVAEKYLRQLTKSLFYRQWARGQLALLRDEAAIDADPTYGKLRKYRVKRDFLFSDQEMDQMLGLLYTHCHDNRNAFEYLMAIELTQRDMNRFMAYYPLGQYAGYTDHIPYAIQQALVYHWTRTHDSFRGMKWSIDPQIANAMVDFIRIYTRNPNEATLREGTLAKTFWSYMLVNKQEARKSHNASQEIY